MDTIVELVSELAGDKVCDIELSELPFAPKQTKERLGKLLCGWRVVVAVGALFSAIVFLINLSLLAWAQARHGGSASGGVLTIFSGSCHHSNTAFLWAHLAINIAGSLLLAASNAACQCLTAPTRYDIDRAHSQGTWLDVGIPSYRNLRFITSKRRIAWSLLVLSSIPLHLLYNSVIFPTSSYNDYAAAVVSDGFLQLHNWNRTTSSALTSQDPSVFNPVLSLLHDKAVSQELEHLENKECIKHYSSSKQSQYRNVLLVTSGSSENGTIFGFIANDALASTAQWLCIGDVLRQSDPVVQTDPSDSGVVQVTLPASCDTKRLERNASGWQMLNDFTSAGDTFYLSKKLIDEKSIFVTVEYCLAERTTPLCTIGMSRTIMIVVIITNFVKLVCFLAVLQWATDRPIITIGDAISSFLKNRDSFTKHKGPLSAHDVRSGAWTQPGSGLKKYTKQKVLWFNAASWKRWTITTVLLCSIYGFVIYLCFVASFGSTLSELWSLGFGTANADFTVELGQNPSLTTLVIVANLPQLLISFAYVFWNNILTSCLLTAEYADYARYRKPLRVTSREESQRSTYWLQIPYRYAIPLLITFTALHWLTSQSIFLVELNVYQYTGEQLLAFSIDACGYSPIAVVFSTTVAGLLVLALYVNGFRRFPFGAPVAASCSAAIAAACHAGAEEGEDMVEFPLMYGVLKKMGTRKKLFRRRTKIILGDEQSVDIPERQRPGRLSSHLHAVESDESITGDELEGEYRRVGFSSLDVEPLVDGEWYL